MVHLKLLTPINFIDLYHREFDLIREFIINYYSRYWSILKIGYSLYLICRDLELILTIIYNIIQFFSRNNNNFSYFVRLSISCVLYCALKKRSKKKKYIYVFYKRKYVFCSLIGNDYTLFPSCDTKIYGVIV